MPIFIVPSRLSNEPVAVFVHGSDALQYERDNKRHIRESVRFEDDDVSARELIELLRRMLGDEGN